MFQDVALFLLGICFGYVSEVSTEKNKHVDPKETSVCVRKMEDVCTYFSMSYQLRKP